MVGKNETQLPVAPLTTSLAARDWLVGGTFTGTTTGSVSGGKPSARPAGLHHSDPFGPRPFRLVSMTKRAPPTASETCAA